MNIYKDHKQAQSLYLPTSPASPDPGKTKEKQEERQLKDAVGMERNKRMKKKLRENRGGAHRWNDG